LADRPQWEAVCADPSLAAAAVDETLRFDGPAKGMPRTATTDVELCTLRELPLTWPARRPADSASAPKMLAAARL
jgi:hypothetical protein